jgi:hypothetical protein
VGVLKSNRSTDTIDLEGCGIGDEGCVLVRDLLLANKCISDLDLQMNQVTDKGAMTLNFLFSLVIYITEMNYACAEGDG